MDLKRLFDKHGLTPTTVCAHATLLDPVSPSRFGTHEIVKAIMLAAGMGVKILLEPHGPVTDFADGLRAIMDGLGNPESVGINMDTRNSWLGGSDPVELAKDLKDQIYHIHWKDLPVEWEEQRGKMWGCGMGPIALGDGVIDVAGVYEVLKDSPHVEHTTLEVGGDENMLRSCDYLKALGAE